MAPDNPKELMIDPLVTDVPVRRLGDTIKIERLEDRLATAEDILRKAFRYLKKDSSLRDNIFEYLTEQWR